MQDCLGACNTWFIIYSRLPRFFLAAHGSNREKLRYVAPYHVQLNGTGSNGRPGPPPFHRHSFRAMKSSSSWHRIRVWPHRVNYDTSTATACHHDNDDCANARIERKARNREHLRAFSFYFRTSRYCNLTPPFVYYKMGGRDPRQDMLDNAQQWQCTKHTLKHSNTPTHRDLGAIPFSTSLYPPYYKHFGAKQHEQQRALEVGTFSPNQYKSCVRLAHHRRLRRAASFTYLVSRHPLF
jgi:hypothetical protein